MPPSFTILLVDDSRASRMLCVALLQSLRPGLRVLEAGDGRAALARLAGERPDLAVLDLNLPDMSGLELAEKIRARDTDIQLALLTADLQDTVRQSAARLDLPFFRKPVSQAMLGEILRLLP